MPNLLRESVRTQLDADVRTATEDISKTSDQADAEIDSAKRTASVSKAQAGTVASELVKVADRTEKSISHANLDEELKLARMELRRVDEVIFGKHLGQGELGAPHLLSRCRVRPPYPCVYAPSAWLFPYYSHGQRA